jgi:protein-tyrosine phosphatase
MPSRRRLNAARLQRTAMIDLHNHLLHGIDDGPATLAQALAMARAFEDQGVRFVACTPHILPGVYHNSGPDIRNRVSALQEEVTAAGLALRLLPGADNHIAPRFLEHLASGELLTIADSRYVLVEPPHNVAPPRLANLFHELLCAGYVPILTHPERLSWIESQYELVAQIGDAGAWMQVTAGSLIGRFGARSKYWAERMLSEGRVHILASDAHDDRRRPPELARGAAAAERLIGAEAAHHLVVTRPEGILHDRPPKLLPPLPAPVADAAPTAIAGRAGAGLAGVLRRLRGS